MNKETIEIITATETFKTLVTLAVLNFTLGRTTKLGAAKELAKNFDTFVEAIEKIKDEAS